MSDVVWVKGKRNIELRGDGWHVSYNRHTGAFGGIITELANSMGGDLHDGEETALYDAETEVFRILEGDFRKEYERAYPSGFSACLKVYEKNKKHRSNWSTDDE